MWNFGRVRGKVGVARAPLVRGVWSRFLKHLINLRNYLRRWRVLGSRLVFLTLKWNWGRAPIPFCFMVPRRKPTLNPSNSFVCVDYLSMPLYGCRGSECSPSEAEV